MLRVLTLATLFPNAAQPTLGVFVERQTLGLAALDDVQVEIVSPVGLPPAPLSRHPHYSARTGLPIEEQWKGLTVHRPRFPVLPMIGQRWTARSMARTLLPLLKQIRARFPFDVIDAEFFWPDGPAAAWLSKKLGVAFSVKARGADISHWGRARASRAQVVAAAHAAGGLLAVSKALREDMIALGMPAEKIAVHYTGIDLDRFAPRDKAGAKADLGIDGPLLISVGALIPRKGQGLAIAALARLPDATLILVGGGPDRGALEKAAAMVGVADRVRFLGPLPHDEVARLMSAADVMVLPCASEGLANVWVEALASGTPVVTSDIPGASEAVSSDVGRLVPRDASAIAAAVRELLARPPSPEALRRAAARFSWNRNALELREHLSKVAAPNPR
jgi:glycosyltransferase involved in cell wall biosynthesis